MIISTYIEKNHLTKPNTKFLIKKNKQLLAN